MSQNVKQRMIPSLILMGTYHANLSLQMPKDASLTAPHTPVRSPVTPKKISELEGKRLKMNTTHIRDQDVAPTNIFRKDAHEKKSVSAPKVQ